MELDFKSFYEGAYGLNAPGRAGQHVWRPEKPVIRDNSLATGSFSKKFRKSISIKPLKFFKPG